MTGGMIQSIVKPLQQLKRTILATFQKLLVLKTLAVILFVTILFIELYPMPEEIDLSDDSEPSVVKVPITEDQKIENPTVETAKHDPYTTEKPNLERMKRRPHIILMVADDLGYNDVGYHGSEIKTPNIDWLASSGIRLENYYVQPVCTPTRSQLMSGRYQIHTGLQHGVIWPSEPTGLPLDSPTLADKLKEAGYATHMVGKWHLGFYKKEYMPTYRGFDTFFGFLTGHEDYYTHTTRHKEWRGYDLRENDKPADMKKYNGSYSTHLFTNRVIDILTEHDESKPIFLYIPFQAPHTPIMVPDSYVEPYKDTIPNEKRRTYAGVVSCMDEAVGNITRALKRLGYWHHSVIIFTTDNGSNEKDGGSNEPLRGHKSQYWEGGIRAVGFMYNSWVAKTRGSSISLELLHVTDWFPTLVNLAGGSLEGTKPLDGYDQWDTLAKGKNSKRHGILINIDPVVVNSGRRLYNNTFDTRIQAAIRIGPWKLITGYPVKGPKKKLGLPGYEMIWLFNIPKDPYEERDLSEVRDDMVQILLSRLEHFYNTSVPVIQNPIDPRADPALHGGFWGPWQD